MKTSKDSADLCFGTLEPDRAAQFIRSRAPGRVPAGLDRSETAFEFVASRGQHPVRRTQRDAPVPGIGFADAPSPAGEGKHLRVDLLAAHREDERSETKKQP